MNRDILIEASVPRDGSWCVVCLKQKLPVETISDLATYLLLYAYKIQLLRIFLEVDIYLCDVI